MKLEDVVVEKAEATEEITYTVIPELRFTSAMLADTTPMSITFQQMFDMFVEAGEAVQEDTVDEEKTEFTRN